MIFHAGTSAPSEMCTFDDFTAEMSQKVVSYLMDFEDHFTSQIYANLYWPTLERFMEEQLPSPECYQPADIVQTESELDPPVEEDVLEKDGATLFGVARRTK
jgi:hypothetical protein